MSLYLVYRKRSILSEPSSSFMSSCSWTTASLGGRRLSCEADDAGWWSTELDGGTDEGGGIRPRLRTASEAAAVVVVSVEHSSPYQAWKGYEYNLPTLGFRKLITRKARWGIFVWRDYWIQSYRRGCFCGLVRKFKEGIQNRAMGWRRQNKSLISTCVAISFHRKLFISFLLFSYKMIKSSKSNKK